MLLSIVKCGDYTSYAPSLPDPPRIKISEDIECIGPVVKKNVADMRNSGQRIAQGEWVFFLDDDCEVSFEQVYDVARTSKGIDAIGGFYRVEETNFLGRAYHQIQMQWVRQGLCSDGAHHLLGGALLVRREVFQKMGGFNTDIGWGGEETEFVARMHRHGMKVRVDSRLQVFHNKKMSWFGFFKRAWFQNFNSRFYKIRTNSTGHFSHYFKKMSWCLFPTALFFSLAGVAQMAGIISCHFHLKRKTSNEYTP